jgi:hypothetical protein
MVMAAHATHWPALTERRWLRATRLAVLGAALGAFTHLEAQVQPDYSCPRRDASLGFPQ